MNPRKKYLIFCFGTMLLAIVLKVLLPTSSLISLFLFLFFTHTLVSAYVIYSLYEMYFLHEKQGSKLSLSKEKLNINWD